MPGQGALQMQQYYADPRKAFWRIMSELLGFDDHADYTARLDALLAAGVGLRDVLRLCDRQGSLDSAIVRDGRETNNFNTLFAKRPSITQLFFKGSMVVLFSRRQVTPNLALPPTYLR